jgi:hypothetical protein
MGRRVLIVSAAWLGCGLALGFPVGGRSSTDGRKKSADGSQPSVRPSLRMSKAVVCQSIDGYEDYETLPGAAMTSDEKLLVYYRPFGYKSARVGDAYQAHFTQDGQVRRRGQKAILWEKKKLLDYTTPRCPQPPLQTYLRNTISLKGLKPGDYEFTIILHDEVAKGATATQVVDFRVIPAADPRKEAQRGRTDDDEPSSPPR